MSRAEECLLLLCSPPMHSTKNLSRLRDLGKTVDRSLPQNVHRRPVVSRTQKEKMQYVDAARFLEIEIDLASISRTSLTQILQRVPLQYILQKPILQEGQMQQGKILLLCRREPAHRAVFRSVWAPSPTVDYEPAPFFSLVNHIPTEKPENKKGRRTEPACIVSNDRSGGGE